MTHLTAEQLVDAAEGTHGDMAVGHLRACEACRRQVADLQALRDTASAAGDVPEPSPLFWDHLSSRVRDAVAAEGGARVAWWRPSAWPWLAMPVGAGTALAFVLAFILTSRGLAPVPLAPNPAPIEASATDPAADDASLSLVADLASQMDWDEASQVGAPIHAGAADEAIGDLSPGERREMQRLLKELAQPGA